MVVLLEGTKLKNRCFSDDLDKGAMLAAIAIKNRTAGKCGCSRPLDNPFNASNCIRCTVSKRGTNKRGMAEARAERAALGLCSCGREAMKGRKQCEDCKARDAARAATRAERLAQRKKAGACTRCGKTRKQRKAEHETPPRASHCLTCTAYLTARKRK